MDDAFELLRYREPEPRADAAVELAEVTGTGTADSERTVRDVLEWYHFGRAGYPQGVDQTLAHLAIHITQPFRIPVMTSRMNRLLRNLRRDERVRTVLDYGGGGGKDSIIFARAGYDVTYADLLGSLTPYVGRRFELRGLGVRIRDVRDLGSGRYDAINCMDVLEHVYDLEYVLADIVARLAPGGRLLCYPAFYNSWDGDHVEKNCGYRPYFIRMVERVGVELEDAFDPHDDAGSAGRGASFLEAIGLRDREMPVLQFVRRRPQSGEVDEERAAIRRELYRLSRRFSVRRAALSAALLPAVGGVTLVTPLPGLRRKGWNTTDRLFSNTIDNLAIWRLSRRRLA